MGQGGFQSDHNYASESIFILFSVDDNLPRKLWAKGRILEVCKAKDGQVRCATIKTVKKIAVLEVLKKFK